MKRIYTKRIRFIAIFLASNTLVQTLSATGAFALTSGPEAPEFSTFTPVATSDMVDLFSGSFNYNIPVIDVPGPHGGGYAMSLAYNSGVNSDQESSWVGLGWSLNPGSINRSMRGVPDDYDNQRITSYNKVRPSWSASASKTVGLEVFSKDVEGGASLQFTRNFNNYTGYHYSEGIGLGYSFAKLDILIDDNEVTFSPRINPLDVLRTLKRKADDNDKQESNSEEASVIAEQKKERKTELHKLKFDTQKGVSNGILSSYIANTYSISSPFYPKASLTNQATTGFSFNWSRSAQLNVFGPVGIEKGAKGTFIANYNKDRNKEYAVKGYLHTPASPEKSNDYILDYHTERGQSLGRFDKYVGIPFANYDVFSVSGEGVLGSFHAYPEQIGQFGPNKTESDSKIGQLGLEVGLGQTIQVGLDVGLGYQKTELQGWVDDEADNTRYQFDRNTAFRFGGDMGGVIEYNNDESNELQTADVKQTSIIPGFKFPYLKDKNSYRMNQRNGVATKAQKSSYIQPIYSSDNLLQGVHVTKSDGTIYQYDQPTLVKNESNVSVNINSTYDIEQRNITTKSNGLMLSVDNSGAYGMAAESFESDQYHQAVVGQVNPNKYAKNFLLTGIVAPSYIDAGAKGLNDDDFGGWTKFNYRKVYGEGKSKWYRYRIPYYGLQYQQNSISDTQDDLGAVTTGQKEVVYLNSIETATHIAYFVTNKTNETSTHSQLRGSQQNRKDGVGAKDLSPTRKNDPAADSRQNALGNASLEYLEKIVLFKKNKQGTVSGQTPLKVVRLAYDYSLVPDTPNSQFENGKNLGKLTLKKLWFEYNGTIPAKISPYQFQYNYDSHQELQVSTPDIYGNIFARQKEFGDKKVNENPSYSISNKGSWGYVTPKRRIRANNGVAWPDQRAIQEQAYDPAAYHLKKITLPSGGEIHVEYEAIDYAHVQDRPAMSMAALTSLSESDNSSSEMTIDPTELGLIRQDFEDTDAYSKAVDDLLAVMNNYYVVAGNRIYFKFLYSLLGRTEPSLDNCKSEYIEGYAKVNGIVQSGDKIKITLSTASSGGGNRAVTPRTACIEFVVNQRQGKLNSNDCIEPYLEAEFDPYIREAANKGSQNDIAKKVPGLLKTIAESDFLEDYDYDEKTLCLAVNEPLSFLRLPVYQRKIVGGSRVKRLLMRDPYGLEAGGTSLYGSEYHYVMPDGSSSGVATNEPPPSREENPLYEPLGQKGQKLLNKLLAGENREQQEGPLGESILPTASIGHRRVVVSNIFKGQSSPGHSIHEFYTCYDYPFDRTYATTNGQGDYKGAGVRATDIVDNKVKDRLTVGAGLFSISLSKLFASQGFLFVQNSMHGKMKETATYPGPYTSETDNVLADMTPTSLTRYDYYQPGEKVRMFSYASDGEVYEEWYVPGKEMEVAQEGRKVKDMTFDFNLELDINIDLPFPPKIYPTFFASLNLSDNAAATHATSKVIRYPAILKKTTNYLDGVAHTTDFIGFNKHTGNALLTATYDSYHLKKASDGTSHQGAVYNFNMPAAWLYPTLGPKTVSALNTNQLETGSVAIITYAIPPIALDNLPSASGESQRKLLDLSQVLQASIQTYRQSWDDELTTSSAADAYNASTEATDEFSRKFLPHQSFVTKAEDLNKSSIQTTGYYAVTGIPNWKQPDNQWLKVSENTLYSPHSEPLEEVNALGIASSVHFGKAYNHNLPIMMSNNAAYENTHFNSFEDQSAIGVPAHAGKQSYPLHNGSYQFEVGKPTLLSEGALLYAWIKGSNPTPVTAQINGEPVSTQEVASVGGWTLYKWVFDNTSFAGSQPVQVTIASTGGTTFLDDVRFQPMKAQATCYVYDITNYRLLAQFDDQHFGLFYQYDQEGKLARKQVETVRGKMTIQETYYNTPEIGR